MLANRRCPVCGGADVELIESLSFVMPAEYKRSSRIPLVSCEQCGFVYKDIKETVSGEKEIIQEENRYEDFEQDFTKAYLEEEAQVIVRRFGKDARMLDVGCCTGYLLYALEKLGVKDCRGLEPSAVSCRKASERGVKVTVGTAYEELPEFFNGFDVIILSQVLEHISDLQLCIKRLYGWLKEGGCLFLSVPDEAHCGEYYGSLSSILSAEHVNHFGAVSLDRLMLGNGFQAVDHVERPYCANLAHKEDRSSVMASMDAVYQKAGRAADEGLPEEGGQGRGRAFERDDSVSRSIKALLSQYQAKKNGIREQAEALGRTGLQFYIWGVSHMAMNLLDEELRDVPVAGFTDSDPSKHGLHVRTLPVVPPGEIPAGGTGIIVLDNHAKDSICGSIQRAGLHNLVYLIGSGR